MSPRREVEFPGQLLTTNPELAKPRSLTLSVSLVVHGLFVAVLLLVPLLMSETLPPPSDVIRAFFVTPSEMVPPPPPPPPPPRAAPATVAARVVTPHLASPGKFVAPIEIPEEIHLDEGLELGITGGVIGGVAGGVPGGVVGGIVGGLSVPRESRKPVRIGGMIQAPKLIRRVPPRYPALALQTRLQFVVILEALVGIDGRVRSVTVLRGHPFLDAAAVEAVRQWRYVPLLLNGEPQEFVLSVTVNYRLTGPQHEAPQ
ncbi:MAG: energy transducer TonB [Deltaproteobacteria bacterium]|nr:energy transducer TonB [Deltaproteobacteria bacterium]